MRSNRYNLGIKQSHSESARSIELTESELSYRRPYFQQLKKQQLNVPLSRFAMKPQQGSISPTNVKQIKDGGDLQKFPKLNSPKGYLDVPSRFNRIMQRRNSHSTLKQDSIINNIHNLLCNIDGVIEKEKSNNKTMERGLNEQKRQLGSSKKIDITEHLMYSNNEKRKLIHDFNHDRKNMFICSGTGQEYFQKRVLKKIDVL